MEVDHFYPGPRLRKSALGLTILVLCAFIVLTGNDFPFRYCYGSVFEEITTTTTTTTTAFDFSLDGSSPYTSTDKTNKNKYT